MTRPFSVYLPVSLGMDQLIATQSTVLAAAGWDLGHHYDAFMRPVHGTSWLEDLRHQRWAETSASLYKYKLTLIDPSFTITEPLKNSSSPLRECLPSGHDFYDWLHKAWNIRNAAQHFDPPMTLELLRERVKAFGMLGVLVKLDLANDCKLLMERLNHLAQGGVVQPPGVIVEQLELSLAGEKAKAKELALQVEAVRRQLSVAASAQTDVVASEIESLRTDLLAAEAEKALAVERLEVMQTAIQVSNADVRGSANDVIDGLTPGDPWPAAPGTRIVRLLPHVGDLFDPLREELLSDSVGKSAVDSSVLWRQFLPNGGPVHLNQAGQACALVGAQYIYLGSLDHRAIHYSD
ncbi:hypothetical protein [Aeromicrobium stalagmiti]|uniref:hypothetical protein n=1 Tax=Aeromicrobium stalagmiti TaxID=2738988 RepID=UPI001569D2F6|nr:hypothetical protein [Aeromicrobium stalagmiti]NRQ50401.1 hypothetical protein [Aeromicrobium stalagmiti]